MTAKAAPLIYIIDDDTDDCELLQSVLSSINSFIQCITARDGNEALKVLKDLIILPDVIVLDLNMPMISGKEVLKELKRDEALSKIPVIVYTTSSDERDKTDALRFGAAQYIVKPSSYKGIESVARSILKRVQMSI
ncbi:MAG TPA: response regulator [Bacteroidia bacterium]|nr:response regulator [Bacteroidia bacterium]